MKVTMAKAVTVMYLIQIQMANVRQLCLDGLDLDSWRRTSMRQGCLFTVFVLESRVRQVLLILLTGLHTLTMVPRLFPN